MSMKLRLYGDESDDELIYCYDCNGYYWHGCCRHPLVFIEDNPVSFPSGLSAARKSLPNFLEIKRSKIPKSGVGVWSKEEIPRFTVFGPYKGAIRNSFAEADRSGYSWEIRRIDGSTFYVDAQDENQSNWLRFVNCSRVSFEQNLKAFQYRENVHYMTLVKIPPETELLVWYGDDYGSELIRSSSNRSWHKNSNGNECKFVCSICKSSFVCEQQRQAHMKHFHKAEMRRIAEQKRFLRNSFNDLTAHVCPECDKVFTKEALLYLHKRSHHCQPQMAKFIND